MPAKTCGRALKGESDPATVPEVCSRKHLDTYGIDMAVLTGAGAPYSMAVHPMVDYAAAYCRAHNDWTLEEWVAKDDRMKASIHIAPADPQQAAAEIDRLGDHPGVAQVLMPAGSLHPFGNRIYHPIYEACERNGLPMCVHFGGEGAGFSAPPTAAGYPTYYLEMRMARPQIAMAHTASLICEGVFEKFPNFKFLFIELDTFWVPGLMWHMDSDWKSLRDYTPWLRRLPSEYLRQHIRFGTQPFPNLPNRRDLETYLDWLHADEVPRLRQRLSPLGLGRTERSHALARQKAAAPRHVRHRRRALRPQTDACPRNRNRRLKSRPAAAKSSPSTAARSASSTSTATTTPSATSAPTGPAPSAAAASAPSSSPTASPA